MKIKVNIKKWCVPLLGGAVAAFSIATESSAMAACYYKSNLINCHTYKGNFWGAECLTVNGFTTYTFYQKWSAGFAPTCQAAAKGNAISEGSSFQGTCGWTYTYYGGCPPTTQSQSQSGPYTAYPCYGSCGNG